MIEIENETENDNDSDEEEVITKLEPNNICIKLAKIAFLLLMKIWDSVYI